ncbi:hypothetical protein SLEP1_g13178 [Rubroshorea leprosula]|uniref:Uncharacterized protein n=1 Tax=Rubroshorea leprosula TaxID=152421 RepID=A0AAV5IEY7_9ROSI|nr:hypothetical protein SLEP1_g13178 [Rubroshorea leprosula]
MNMRNGNERVSEGTAHLRLEERECVSSPALVVRMRQEKDVLTPTVHSLPFDSEFERF